MAPCVEWPSDGDAPLDDPSGDPYPPIIVDLDI